MTERPVGTAINATPNPFDPFSGEHVTLTVPAARAGSHVVAGVFDLDGRRIADVGSASAFPAVFVWDGRDADGRMVVVGLYILICEFYSNAGYSRRVEKVVVGCAREKR